jgi:hypothetical protein
MEFHWDKAWERGMGWNRGYGETNLRNEQIHNLKRRLQNAKDCV